MRKTTKYTFYLLFTIILLTLVVGCKNSYKQNEEKREKSIQELEYLDTKIVEIANDLNNISLENYAINSEKISIEQKSSKENEESDSQNQTSTNDKSNNIKTSEMQRNSVISIDEKNINWEKINSNIEIINESWSVVILDLTSLNINNEDILNFSKTLNNSIIAINNTNKKESLLNISKLYSYIPKFEESINSKDRVKDVKQIKSNLLNSYALLENNDWNSIEINIKEAKNTFTSIVNDIEFKNNKEHEVNNAFILLNELNNSLQYKDKKLFLIKYKAAMSSLNML